MNDMSAKAPTMSNLESAIRDLVSGHEAFWQHKMTPVERRVPSDWEAIRTWAGILKGAQEYLGIVMVDPEIIDHNIAEAEHELKARSL